MPLNIPGHESAVRMNWLENVFGQCSSTFLRPRHHRAIPPGWVAENSQSPAAQLFLWLPKTPHLSQPSAVTWELYLYMAGSSSRPFRFSLSGSPQQPGQNQGDPWLASGVFIKLRLIVVRLLLSALLGPACQRKANRKKKTGRISEIGSVAALHTNFKSCQSCLATQDIFKCSKHESLLIVPVLGMTGKNVEAKQNPMISPFNADFLLNLLEIPEIYRCCFSCHSW